MRRFLMLCAVLVTCSLHQPAADAKIAPIPFPQLIAKADFVGIVECEIAGAVVAKYKVIESCRGAKAGERIVIRSFVRSPGPQYHTALAGKRYFVTAQLLAPEHEVGVPLANIPLTWRKIQADYWIPYGEGPSPEGPDTAKRFAEARKLVAAAPAKAEFVPAKPLKEIVWTIPPRPTPAQLADWRKMVDEVHFPTRDPGLTEAKEGLYAYEPTQLFKNLVAWEGGAPGSPRRVEYAHATASYAAWRCGQEREKHLKMLLTAQEPMVRVAGAVYLCFEDTKLGQQELTKLTKLEDEAGAWAALTLARRGNKDAVPRVLELFNDQRGEALSRSYYHRQLRLNSLVLFSNSALKSDVPQPPSDTWGNVEAKAMQAWWRQHSAKITLHDPWLEMLSKQKID